MEVKVTCKKQCTEGAEGEKGNIDKAKKLFLKGKSFQDRS